MARLLKGTMEMSEIGKFTMLNGCMGLLCLSTQWVEAQGQGQGYNLLGRMLVQHPQGSGFNTPVPQTSVTETRSLKIRKS